MSLSTNVQNFATAVGTDVKTINNKIGNLPSLNTSAKSDLVSAINEVSSAAASATGINDNSTSASTTWSSSKISNAISASSPSWSSLTGKPDTFTPTTGTTADTAKPGDWEPSWNDVTDKPNFAAVATSGNYSDLTGTIPTSALPNLTITNPNTVDSQSAMLGLSSAQPGDVAIRTDNGAIYMLVASDPSQASNWKEIDTAGAVTSVNGKTGTVSLVASDLGLGNVNNTADADKPISTATQAALDNKATIGTTSGTAADAGAVGDTTIDYVAVYNAAKNA